MKSNAESDFFNYFVLSSRAIANSRSVSAFSPDRSKPKAIIYLKKRHFLVENRTGICPEGQAPENPHPLSVPFFCEISTLLGLPLDAHSAKRVSSFVTVLHTELCFGIRLEQIESK